MTETQQFTKTSGASIAGPALACWLTHDGVTVTIVEQSQTLRAGGHKVDIHSVAMDVVERTGLIPHLRRRDPAPLPCAWAGLSRGSVAASAANAVDNSGPPICAAALGSTRPTRPSPRWAPS
ncbi:hypothetical protein ACQP1G_30390 [Nocardia sp. CA-107356]|uniref:hypothetical protein n=1 Tax=Nocardia sp. CA-107356 TaxID=3239972 RepID=UPI003D912710